MHRASRRVLSLVAVVMAVGGFAATSVQAGALHINGERTVITPNAQTLAFLSAFGITTQATGPASLSSDGSLVLPITSGFVTTSGPPMAEIWHSGGVTFSNGTRSLDYRDFRLVHRQDRTWWSALLNDRGRVIFAWVNPVHVVYLGQEATVTGELKLSEQAADAFDWLIGSHVAVPGSEIAKMKSTVRAGGS